MKTHVRTLLLLSLFLLSGKAFSQTFFQKTYSHTDGESGTSVIATADGGYLVGGTSGANYLDKIFLVKTDANGAIQWTKNYGGSVAEYLASVIQNPDGTYMLVGTTYSFNTQPYGNIYILKIDAGGNLLWSKHYGASGADYGYSIQRTADAGYIVGGLTNSMGAGYYDYYAMKIDSAGNPAWATTIGGWANDEGFSVAVLDDGTYLMAGQANSFPPPQMIEPYQVMLCKLSTTGSVLWTKTYSAGLGNCISQQMIKTSDGGCIMAGWTDSFGSNNDDIYVIKADSAGNQQWTSTFGGPGTDIVFSVSEKPAGGYILGGYTESYGGGAQDMLLASIDSVGTLQWATAYGDSLNERGNSVITTNDGGYLLTGLMSSIATGTSDVYLIKTDASGFSGGCYENDAPLVQYPSTTITYTITPTVSGAYLGLAPPTQVGTGGTVATLCGNVGIAAPPAATAALDIAPNPATQEVRIGLENADQLEIVDALGRVVYTQQHPPANAITIDVSAWPKGIYLVRAHAGSNLFVKRLAVL